MNKPIQQFYETLLRHEAAIFLVFLLFSGLFSVSLGQDINWDLRNYHFYNAWAFLNQRLNVDILPAQLQTYINPTLDIPGYLLITTLPPMLTGFLWGAVHGINQVLVFKIAQYVIRRLSFSPAQTFTLAFLITVLSFLGAVNTGQLGGFMGDNTVAIFVLIGIWFLLHDLDAEQPSKVRNVLLAGLCVGLATGLKLTSAIFVLSLGVCPLIFKRTRGAKIRATVWFGAMAVLGLLLTSGYWMLVLASKFQNPVFPFYNAIFQSSYISPLNYAVPYEMPQSLAEYILWPLHYLTPHEFTRFTDFRLSIVFGVAILVILIKGCRLIRKRHGSESNSHQAPAPAEKWRNPTIALLFIFFASYFVWLIEFYIYRFQAPLEFLSITVILTLFWMLVPSWKYGVAVLVVLHGVLIPTTTPANFERVPWSQDFFAVRLPANLNLDNALVLVTSTYPLGYIFPFFPISSQIVRLESNMDIYLDANGESGLTKLMHQALSDNTNRFVLFPDAAQSGVDAVLERFGLQVGSRCYVFETKTDSLQICTVVALRGSD